MTSTYLTGTIRFNIILLLTLLLLHLICSLEWAVIVNYFNRTVESADYRCDSHQTFGKVVTNTR